VLGRPAQTASAEREGRPFITQSNVPSTHPRSPLCNIASALLRRLTQASGEWPEDFRKKTQGGPVLAAEQITTADEIVSRAPSVEGGRAKAMLRPEVGTLDGPRLLHRDTRR
jgi:hypothetical protein